MREALIVWGGWSGHEPEAGAHIVGKMLESGDLSGLKFTLSNAAKDLRYYTHFTESLMLPSIVGEAVHQSLVTANALGFGDKYVPSLIEAQEKLAGIAIVPR